MRHLLFSKVAPMLLALLLVWLPATPAQADEIGDSFFAEIAGYFQALLAGWAAPGDTPELGYSYPPGGSPTSAASGLGYSYPPHALRREVFRDVAGLNSKVATPMPTRPSSSP